MSNSPDVGGSSYSYLPGSFGTTPTGSTQPTAPSAPKKTGYSSKDTISAAELAASLSMMMNFTASSPTIPAPSNETAAMDASIMQLSNQYHKICTNMLDSWTKSVQDQAEEAKKQETSPVKLAIAEGIKKKNLGLVDSVRSYADQMKTADNTEALGSLTNSLMTVGAFLGVAAVGITDAATKMVNIVTPQVNFAVSLVTQATSTVADDLRAQLGLIGALAMGPIINSSTIETIYDKLSGKAADDKVMAEKYGTKTLQLINSNQLNQFISGMLVNKTENGKPLTDQRKQELTAVIKVIMLSSALAAVYKSKTGKITDQEFLDLALGRGNMKPDGAIETQLVAAIQAELGLMAPKEKFQVLNALGSYMNSDPKLKSLFDVGNTFDDVNETLSVGPDVTKT